MKRTALLGVLALAATVACGGGERPAGEGNRGENEQSQNQQTQQNPGTQPADPEYVDDGADRPQPITVTGCLTSKDGRFVLTELDSAVAGPSVARRQGGTDPAAENQPTTETYQLTGMDDQLRQHVGRRVRVNGEAEPPRVAVVRESSPQTDPRPGATGTSGRRERGGTQPQVSTQQQTRLEVTTLMVRSVNPTGDSCEAGQRQGDRR